MSRLIPFLMLWPLSLAAQDAPKVVTDIAPIHSLVAQVMGDVGTPELLLPPGADPHDFALRPSDARRLSEADLVIWTGPGLTPWLEEPIATLAPNAQIVTLLDSDGWDSITHDDKDDDAHDHHGHDHDHSGVDPHAWLDPTIAGTWVGTIQAALAAVDATQAPAYQSNADQAVARLADLETALEARLAGLQDRSYVLAHDGYGYFERRYRLTHSDAITDITGQTSGPAHIAALREQIASQNIVCVFGDLELGSKWVDLVSEGTDARTEQINPIGAGLTPGPALYGDMLRELAGAFERCLAGS